MAGLSGYRNAFGLGDRCGQNHAKFGHSRTGTKREKSLCGNAVGGRARGPRIVSDPVRFLSWNRRQREDAGGAPSLSESTGPARGGNPETHGRRTPLHHRKRSPAYGDAWLGEPTHRVGRRELEACSFSPELPASQPRRAVATSDNGRFGTLHRIAGLREVPRGDLYALEEDADGERGARSCDEHPDAIIPDLRKPTPWQSSPRTRSPSSTAACGSSAISPRSAMTIFPCRRSGTSRNRTAGARIMSPKARIGGQPFYPPDNMQRPTGPLCDGCHSVELQHPDQDGRRSGMSAANAATGPAASTSRIRHAANILNPAQMDYVARERHLHPVPFAGTAR